MALYDEQQSLPAPAAAPPAAAPPPAAAAPPPGASTQPMPAAQEPSYGLKHAIVDALSQKLGFGTPIRNVETMRMAENSQRLASEQSQMALDQARKKDMLDEAAKTMAPYFLAVGKPDSRYYKDMGHFAEGVNQSEKTKAFLGGELVAQKTDKTNDKGDAIWSVGVRGKDGQMLQQFEDTTDGAMNRFDASLHPQVGAVIRGEIAKTNAEQQLKIDNLRKYADADMATKQAMGITVDAVDKWKYLKDRLPEHLRGKVSDWQLMEAAGLKIEDRYKPLSTTFVPLADDRLGMLVEDRDTRQTKVIPVAGSTWSGYKQKTEKEALHWKNAYWPDTDEDGAHERKAKGLFAAELEAAAGVPQKRDLLDRVLPEFRTWVELQEGEVDDGKGGRRKLTTSDMHARLKELMKAAGGAAGEKAPAEKADDQGDWGFYKRQQQNKGKAWKNFMDEPAPEQPSAKEKRASQASPLSSLRSAALTTYPDSWMSGRD